MGQRLAIFFSKIFQFKRFGTRKANPFFFKRAVFPCPKKVGAADEGLAKQFNQGANLIKLFLWRLLLPYTRPILSEGCYK